MRGVKSRVDAWLAAAVLTAGVLEVTLRSDLPSRAAALGFVAVIAGAVLFRRRSPLGAMAAAFGLASAVTAVEWALALPKVAAVSAAPILLLPYTLARWGSRRDGVIGAGLIVVTWLLALLNGEMKAPGDAIGSAVVMLFPASIGAVVRFRAEAQAKELGQARLLEREQLARELHDSVAHHLVAITVQAQAAKAVLASRPEQAAVALGAIEDESKRVLSELRTLVGSLREGEADLAPAGRIADLPALAQRAGGLAVDVQLEGDVARLAPAVERAVFRLAQESITNAVKHAKNATKVEVRVAVSGASVRLLTRDDGEASAAPRRAGFGLVGMAERAALLGGTFEAGPLTGRGWQVEATLPLAGRPS